MTTYQNDYLATVRPTYIENWPAALAELSVPQSGVELTRSDVQMLGAAQEDYFELWEKPDGIDLESIRNRIDRAISEVRVPGVTSGVFVRLGSRSPKDSWWPWRDDNVDGFRGGDWPWPLRTADDCLGVLLGASERVNDDLLLAYNTGYTPWIFVRQWEDIPKWAEFRCFMRDGELVGVSQYLHDRPYQEVIQRHELFAAAIDRFFTESFRPACHMDTCVFDVWVKVTTKGGGATKVSVRLLEINPFFRLTDPCLLRWDDLEQAGYNDELKFVEE